MSATTTTSNAGAWVTAVVGTVLLTDAAIETVSAGSSVRWWTVGAMLLYPLGAALAWRTRMTSRARLGIVGLIFLGLLAVTVWRPEGLTNGVRLAGQPTAVVLSCATVAVLLVAGWVLLQATVLPLAARLVAALLVTYGVAGFGLGAWQAMAYPALFAGGSWWHPAPRWLQGAMVGGLVVLLALLVDVLGGLRREKRVWRPQQIVALGLALVMVASGITNAAGLNQRGITLASTVAFSLTTGAPAVSSRPVPPDTAAVALAHGTALRLLGSTPKSAFDVDLTAAELGADVGAMFAFVRDNIRQEIYAGILRGARGTLISHAGNAWDKSVLLAALLRHGGRDVRFARGRLAPDRAAALVSRMFDQASGQVAVRIPDVPDAIATQGRTLVARIESQWHVAQTDLIAALDRSGVTLGDAPPVSETALNEEATDHLWVEYRDGDRWVALDPSAARQPGEAVATSTETFQEIPESLFHRVTFRVRVEERRQQAIEEHDAFVWQTTAAAVHGAGVLFTHRIGQTPLGNWRATPMLFVDGQAYGALSFTEAGIEGGKAANALVAEASRQMQGVGGLSELFGSSAPPLRPSTPTRELTAVSLDVEFVYPAGHRDVVRRQIVDRIGPVARARNLAATAPLIPLAVASGVPVALSALHGCAVTAGTLDPRVVLERVAATSSAADDGVALQKLMQSGATPLPPEEQPRVRHLVENLPAVLESAAQEIHVLSQRLATRIRTSSGVPLFYEATPRLAIVSLEPGGSPLAVDLRRNGLRVVARGSQGRDAVRANLARGVLDGVIEDAVAAHAAAGVPGAIPISTVAVFDSARNSGVRLVAASAGGGVPPSAVPDAALARVAAAIEQENRLVVMPEQAVSIASTSRFAWWQVDPQTGETVGVLDTGLHGAQPSVENPALADTVALPGARALGAGAASDAGGGFITITLSAKEALIVGVGLGVLATGVAFMIVAIIVTT